MSDKLYVPGCFVREKRTQYGPLLSIGAKADSLVDFIKQHTNERGYINFVISPRREPKEGVTHSIYLDEYDSSKRRDGPRPKTPQSDVPPMDDLDRSVPF